MYVLGVVGSPRKDGNTSVLMQNAMEAMGDDIEKDIVYLVDMDISGCRGCEGCQKTGKCIIDDDMQQLYPMIERADALVLGSPTYFYDMTSLMKAFLERMYCYEIFHDEDRSVWSSRNELMGPAYAVTIATCEQESGYDMGFTSLVMDRALQSLGYRVVDSVKVTGVFSAGEVREKPEALQKARSAGRRLSLHLRMMRDRTPPYQNETSHGFHDAD